VALNGALTAAPGSAVRVQSNGSIGPATLTVANGFTNNGVIELGQTVGGSTSTLVVSSGTLTNASGGSIIASGTGGRTINAFTDNAGTISLFPGASGNLTIAGGLNSSGTIALDLAGAGQYGQLSVNSGALTLGGTLNVGLFGGFVPQSTDTFTPVSSSTALTGTFGTLSLPPGMTAQYNPNSVVLTAAPLATPSP
jgi:hypothetical protein